MIRAAAGGLALLALIAVPFPRVAADPVRGERVFQRCYACHSVVAGEDGLPGPNLRCVLGRRAGTLAGFRFSPAMASAGRGFQPRLGRAERSTRFSVDRSASCPRPP